MKKFIPFFALVALTFGMGLTGCKSAEEKACENLAEVAGDDAPDDLSDMDACVESMKEMKEECKNGDEVLECLAEIEDKEGFMECAGKCEEK